MATRRTVLAAAALAALLAAAQATPGGRRQALQAPPAPQPRSCCDRLRSVGFQSNLPVVILDSRGSEVLYRKQTPSDVCTCNSGAGFADYVGAATAAVRGTSSANFTKKSFALDLMDAAGKPRDFALLGMPADGEWILYGGDEVDLTQGMRNYLAYNLARQTGHYAPRTVYVEVFLVSDGRPLSLDHYNGIYIATEKVKRGKARVDIQKLEPPDLSGGFLVLYDNDNTQEGDVLFGPLAGWGHPFQLKYPGKSSKDTKAATDWLLGYLGQLQAALQAPDWLGRQGGASYRSYVDMPSWRDFFLLVELTKNPDGYRGSTYFYKDRGGPVQMGPVWDYNEAFGLCCGYPIDGWQSGGRSGPGQSGGSAISPEGWRFMICADQGRCQVDPTDGFGPWYRRMWQDSSFRQGAAARWGTLRAGPWSDAAVDRLISDVTAQIKPAVLRNWDKYSKVLTKPGFSSSEQQWLSEVNQLQGWLISRLAWLDGAFAAVGAGMPAAPAVKAAGG